MQDRQDRQDRNMNVREWNLMEKGEGEVQQEESNKKTKVNPPSPPKSPTKSPTITKFRSNSIPTPTKPWMTSSGSFLPPTATQVTTSTFVYQKMTAFNSLKDRSSSQGELHPKDPKSYTLAEFRVEVDKFVSSLYLKFDHKTCMDIRKLYEYAFTKKKEESNYSFYLYIFEKLSKDVTHKPTEFRESFLQFNPMGTEISVPQLYGALIKIARDGNNSCSLIERDSQYYIVSPPPTITGLSFKGSYVIDENYAIKVSTYPHFAASSFSRNSFGAGDISGSFVSPNIIEFTFNGENVKALHVNSFSANDQSGCYHLIDHEFKALFMDHEPTDEDKKLFQKQDYTFCFIHKGNNQYDVFLYFFEEKEKLAFAQMNTTDIPGLDEFLKGYSYEKIEAGLSTQEWNKLLILLRKGDTSLLMKNLPNDKLDFLFEQKLEIIKKSGLKEVNFFPCNHSLFKARFDEILLKKLNNHSKYLNLSHLSFRSLINQQSILNLLSEGEMKTLAGMTKKLVPKNKESLTDLIEVDDEVKINISAKRYDDQYINNGISNSLKA